MSPKFSLVLIAGAALFALTGCGLTPVYGTYANSAKNSAVAAQLDQVYIDSIPDRTGQKLRNTLMDRFYQTGRKNLIDARYRLRVANPVESIYGLGIAKDATATRSQIRLYTTFTLTRVGDAEATPLITRKVESVSSFDTLASEYTTLVTEQDARDQVIKDMADQIATLLELYFTNPSRFPSPETIAEDDKKSKHVIDPRGDIEDNHK